MPMELKRLVDGLQPERTVLLLGAGSSVPSHAPSGNQLRDYLANKFAIDADGYTLAEIASLVEQRHSRTELIEAMRSKLRALRPTGGLLNLPLYPWRSVFTTNYDTLIEQCYEHHKKSMRVFASDFDFRAADHPESTKLFKLHGTIDQDVVDGHASRMIITEADYDLTGNYREALYDRLASDTAGGHLLIVGHSLADADIREVANRTADQAAKTYGAWKISLLLYVRDDNRASLFEARGFKVAFGGVDELFAELAQRLPSTTAPVSSEEPLGAAPALRPRTLDITREIDAESDVSAMFNGWPASYADISSGLTFERTIASELEQDIRSDDLLCAILLGASGVGKSTAARQALLKLRHQEFYCWEHKSDSGLDWESWLTVAKRLQADGARGVLLIDEAHAYLPSINMLVDSLSAHDLKSLKLVCVSTRNHWNPRIKTPLLFRKGKTYKLAKLEPAEIDRLLNLVDNNGAIRALVEHTFSGFSRYERRRRLIDRCESETFVCLKNIFASEKFDDIILREYAALSPLYQDIYEHLAAMETAGIRVHRQLLIRLLGIPADQIGSALAHLADIVHEYEINDREGVYGWRGRHPVIVAIIAKYKFPDLARLVDLFSSVIDAVSPTYDVEVRSMRELCSMEGGISRIADKSTQNTLLRKIMSVVPGERVPRHRLIRNLIEMGEFEKAETEIRIFEKDFGRDGPVARYKVSLLTARALQTVGIMEEDRLAILGQARALAELSVRRFPFSTSLLVAYAEVGVAIHRKTGDYGPYDDAIAALRDAEERIGDAEIGRQIARFERRMSAPPSESLELAVEVAEDE